MFPKKGGRHRDPVWNFFQEVIITDVDGKEVMMQKCMYCNEKISARPERMKTHLVKCKIYNVKKHEKAEDTVEQDDTPPAKKLANAPSTSSQDNHDVYSIKSTKTSRSQPQATVQMQQPKIGNYTVSTTKLEKDKLDLSIAELFLGAGISFNVADSPHFKKVVHLLRPGYEPPSAKDISGKLLDKVYDRLQSNVADTLKDQDVTLMQDGYSNVHNQPIIGSAVGTGKNTLFVTTTYAGEHKKDAEFCFQMAKREKENIENQYNCKVRSFVSDSEFKMKTMRSKLQEEFSNEDFYAYGCSSHYLNLLGEDIFKIKEVNSIYKQVEQVQKYFRNHHMPGALLMKIEGALKPVLGNVTRWNGEYDTIKNYVYNKKYYVQVFEEIEQKSQADQHISKIVSNVHIFSETKTLVKVIQPLADALLRCEADNCNIAEAAHLWLSLYNNPELLQYQNQIKKRLDDALSDEHFLGYLIHPEYKGKLLSEKQKEDTRHFIASKDEAFLPFIIAFQAQDDPFPQSFFTEFALKMNPVTWWKAHQDIFPKRLFDLIIHILKSPASSAGIERVFSDVTFIHNNRILKEKCLNLKLK